MALSYKSVQKAFEILTEINPVCDGRTAKYNAENEFQQNKIIVLDGKADGGYENVFMNIENPTPAQLDIFEQRQNEVPNSAFCRHKVNGITRLGWF